MVQSPHLLETKKSKYITSLVMEEDTWSSL